MDLREKLESFGTVSGGAAWSTDVPRSRARRIDVESSLEILGAREDGDGEG